MLVIISGPSGVGKNTIIEELLKQKNNLKYLKSCTTRTPRENETQKGYYIYINPNDISKMIENNELFEHEDIHGNVYGTLNSSIQDIIDGETDYVKDLGVLGQKFFVNSLKNKIKVLSFYLTCPKDILESRLIGRGEKEVEKRLERFDFEESHKGNFDFVVENLNMDETISFIMGKIEENR